jgi:pyruvate,orthophosphate dikinase
MTYVYAFDQAHGMAPSELRKIIGSKAANLAVMANELHLPVPPGFAVSTAACREYLAHGWPDGLEDEIRRHLARVEAALGRGFGDPAEPLLVSVRSGAPVSMPGMMDTLLNLGLNEATAQGLARISGDGAFVTACRQRLSATYPGIVGVSVPDDPWQQLRGAVEAVFRSWNGDRARAYRSREGIPDDLGTGVIVQAMVFGNWGTDSATGVLFTRNPATGENVLYGDVMFRAQGEDVVAGTHQTEPIAVLDVQMPAVAAELRGYADALERYYADVCDIEFTIERGRLWMLQTRIGKRSPQAALRIAVEMAEDDGFPLSRAEAVKRVAHLLADPPKTTTERGGDTPAVTAGLPASPGLASGEIATTPEAAIAVAEAGRPVILVRAETSPDDVHGMARAVGILTATGGLASHAAVVARGWGIPAVVGASAVQVGDGTVSICGHILAAGDVLTIDGSSGEVFVGAIGGRVTIVPEASTLLSWAGELGIEIPGAQVGEASGVSPGQGAAGPAVPPTKQMAIRALLIKGFAVPEAIAVALQTTVEEAATILEHMRDDGLAKFSADMYRLTPDGTAAAGELIAADRAQWGAEQATEALDAFLPLDHGMKAIVTAWQMRQVDGEQVLNDHSDAAYDASVLADVDSLHREVAAWIEPLSRGLPRLGAYGARLETAASLVRGGDHRYIASPRVDSYHSIWFELHEDLILLAGRTRADEVAAGRA